MIDGIWDGSRDLIWQRAMSPQILKFIWKLTKSACVINSSISSHLRFAPSNVDTWECVLDVCMYMCTMCTIYVYMYNVYNICIRGPTSHLPVWTHWWRLIHRCPGQTSWRLPSGPTPSRPCCTLWRWNLWQPLSTLNKNDTVDSTYVEKLWQRIPMNLKQKYFRKSFFGRFFILRLL